MIRIIILFFFSLSCMQFYAQDDVVDQIVHIRKLLSDPSDYNPQEAFSHLQQIEKKIPFEKNDTIKAVFYSLKGDALYGIENYQECIPFYKDAILLLEQINLLQYDYLNAYYGIATAYHRLKDFKNAESYYRKAILRSVSANVDSVDNYRSSIYINLGRLYEARGDSTLANECYKRVNQNMETNLIDVEYLNYIEWENSCWDKIESLTHSGKYQEAVDVYSEMIQGILSKKGKGDTYILAVYSKAILLSRYLNKYEEALPLYEEVIKCGNLLSISNESVCGAYCSLALSYAYMGNFSKVDSFVPEAKEFLFKANNDSFPPHSIYRFVGNGAYWAHKYEMAVKYYEQYVSSTNKRERGANYDEITNQLSVSYIYIGQPNEAKKLLLNYLKIDEARLQKEKSPILANIYHNLGRAYMLEDSRLEALNYLTKSKDLQMNINGEVAERTLLYLQECQTKK